MSDNLKIARRNFAKHLRANLQDLELCRRYGAKMAAEALHDDNDLEVLYDMLLSGVPGYQNATATAMAEELIDEDTMQLPIFDVITVIRKGLTE